MNTIHKKNDHPAYLYEETPGLLSVGWDLFYHTFIIRQMSQNVKDPIKSIIKFTVGKEYFPKK